MGAIKNLSTARARGILEPIDLGADGYRMKKVLAARKDEHICWRSSEVEHGLRKSGVEISKFSVSSIYTKI